MATSGILVTQFDYSKLFIWNNFMRTATLTNSSGGTLTYAKGTVLGRIFSSNKVYPAVSSAINGSQVPMGVLANDYTVANSASVTVTYCISGKVARELLIFGGSDTLATIITLNDSAGTPNTTQIGTIEDILNRSGIITESMTENTLADNA